MLELGKGVRSQSQAFSSGTVLYEAFFSLEENMNCTYFWASFSCVFNLSYFLSFSYQLLKNYSNFWHFKSCLHILIAFLKTSYAPSHILHIQNYSLSITS